MLLVTGMPRTNVPDAIRFVEGGSKFYFIANFLATLFRLRLLRFRRERKFVRATKTIPPAALFFTRHQPSRPPPSQ